MRILNRIGPNNKLAKVRSAVGHHPIILKKQTSWPISKAHTLGQNLAWENSP